MSDYDELVEALKTVMLLRIGMADNGWYKCLARALFLVRQLIEERDRLADYGEELGWIHPGDLDKLREENERLKDAYARLADRLKLATPRSLVEATEVSINLQARLSAAEKVVEAAKKVDRLLGVMHPHTLVRASTFLALAGLASAIRRYEEGK